MKRSISLWVTTFVSILLLSACGESQYVKQEENVRTSVTRTSALAVASLTQLDSAIKSGDVRNANLIKLYANQLKTEKPNMALIVDELAKDATLEGPLYKNLNKRLAKNSTAFQNLKDQVSKSDKKDSVLIGAINSYTNQIIPEYDALIGASDPEVFNDALGDIVNSLADMSDDKLARVDGKKSSDFYAETGAKNAGGATMLVGNDNYGQWKQDSKGNSFWEFYGQYRLLSDVLGTSMGGSRYYYNDWHNTRPYSSYNDYYGSRYSSYDSRSQRSSLNSKYNLSGTQSKAATAYVKKNPTVTKKFDKFDSQFKAKRPGSLIQAKSTSTVKNSNTLASKPQSVKTTPQQANAPNGNKFGDQYKAKPAGTTTNATKPASSFGSQYKATPSNTTTSKNSSGSLRSTSSSRSSGKGK